MTKIFIIGNGFDLAHGLKTSYSDFLKYLINKSINYDNKIRGSLIDVGFLDHEKQSFTYIKENFRILAPTSINAKNNSNKITFHNELLLRLMESYFESNWVDIEQKYFNILANSSDSLAQQLNSDMREIKYFFIEYLKIETESLSNAPHPGFIEIFDNDNDAEICIVNFNYTKTASAYMDSISAHNKKLVNIHGVLDKPVSVIFGYGNDSNPKSIELKNREKDIYIENFKSNLYNLDNQYEELRDSINNAVDIDICCIGHSLGVSDRTLLKELFDNPKVNSIELFYYNNSDNYVKLNNEISRFTLSSTFRNKIISLPNSHKIPQIY